MADSDMFGDPSLFEEFEKERQPPDKLLLTKLQEENGPQQLPRKHVRVGSEELGDEHTNYNSAGDSDTGSEIESDSESESDKIINGTEAQNAEDIAARIRSIRKATEGDSYLGKASDNRIDQLTREVLELRRENARLKEKARIVDPTIRFCDGRGPGVEVIFLNEDFARTYRGDIENYIRNLLEQHAKERGHLPQVALRASNVPLSTKADLLLSDEAIKHINASTVLGCSQFYSEFMVDALGWPLVDETPALTDGWTMPRYEQPYKESLPCEEEEEDDLHGPSKKEAVVRPKNSCFNCDGNHRLSECPEPKNQARIAEKAREFKEAKANMPQFQKQVRYHEDSRGGEKYKHLKPGVFSDSLREALGLQKDQLAPFVYQMRVMGYPPGWLEEARVQTSGLSMFGRDGSEMTKEGEDYEDGQVEDGNDDNAEKYDTSKIIEFPGFNVPCLPGVNDECEALCMPPMQPQHEKSVLELYLTKNTSDQRKRIHSEDSMGGSKKKKLRPNSNDSIHTPSDMDISSQEEEEQTLAELENYRKKLQESLASESGADTPPIPPTPPQMERPPLPLGTPPATPPVRAADVSFQTPQSAISRGSSLIMTPGTPVLTEIGDKEHSLPNAEKWADGIIEHIPYENLPGATGTFEKLRKTLSSIRASKKK